MASRSSARSGPSRSGRWPTAVTAWPATRARSSSCATRCPASASSHGSPRGGWATASCAPTPSRCSRPLRAASRPRARMPPPASAVGATSSTRPSRRSGSSRRRSCGSSSRGSPASRSRSTCGRCPGDEDGLRWRTRVEFAVDESGRAGLRRHRSRDIVPVDDCLIATRAVIDSGVLDTEWPDLESVDVVDAVHPDEPVLVPLPAPEGGERRRWARRRARPRRRLGGRVRRRCPWLLAGPPGRGLDLPVPGHGPARGAPG